ncbi:MAG: MYXO-CTERM sorting domain-containing protein, partial [Myxococcaceae bacterium]
CGGENNVITVELQDSLGNPVNAGPGGQAFTVTSSSPTTATWHTDPVCTAPADDGAFTIPEGSSSANLYYRDMQVGTPQVSATNGVGLVNPSDQTHTVNPMGQSEIVVLKEPALLSVGCSCSSRPEAGSPVPAVLLFLAAALRLSARRTR